MYGTLIHLLTKYDDIWLKHNENFPQKPLKCEKYAKFDKQRWPPVSHLESEQHNFWMKDVSRVDVSTYQISSQFLKP